MTGKIDKADLGGLIEKLAHVKGAAKALGIGAAHHHDWLVSLARGVRMDGMLIVLAPGPEGMRALRAAFEAAGVAARAHVMPGNPALLVRKVAGPFDIVVNCEEGNEEVWRARLTPLVARGGLLITAWEDGIRIEAR